MNLTDGLDSHCENMRTMEAVPREAGWLHFQEGCCPVHENHVSISHPAPDEPVSKISSCWTFSLFDCGVEREFRHELTPMS